MEKIYIPGCTNSPYECPTDLYLAIKRAKIWCKIVRVAQIMHITSRNSDAPFTDDEKNQFQDMLVLNNCPYRAIFDN